MTHLLNVILSTRVCHSFVCTSFQTTRPLNFPPTILFAKDATKSESDDLQNTEDWEEWDGEPREGAHDSEFEDGSGNNDDFFFLSAEFMSMATSVASPALPVIGTGSSAGFDPSKNAGKIHLAEEDFDLEEIGGDSGFLDEEEETEIDTEFGKIKFTKSMDDDLFWEVDESAHFD